MSKVLKYNYYFCIECKKEIKNLAEVFYVEEQSSRSFCSEECIESFYEPLVKKINKTLKKIRESHDLVDEPDHDKLFDPHILQEILKTPDEIYILENEVSEYVNLFCKRRGEATDFVVCFTYEFKPSFIIAGTSSANKELVNALKQGEKIKDITPYLEVDEEDGPFKNFVLSDETIQYVEGKKSRILAEFLEKRSESDIPLESFTLYEKYIEPTLMKPDEIFKYVDDEGDNIYTYIKALHSKGVSFFQFVICLKLKELEESHGTAMLPVVVFPTLDATLIDTFRKGSQITGNLKN